MEDYSAKLTGEPFLYNETKIIAEYLLKGFSAEELKKKNLKENLIKHKTIGSITRVNSPIFRRLNIMTDDMLKDFVESDIDNSKYILLYSIMKTDRLVRDFVIEVYKDKLILRKEYIEKYDIDNWYDEKCILSSSLKEKSDKTSAKLKQVIMKILSETGLVIKEKTRFKVVRPLLRESYINMLDRNNDIEYAKAIGGLM
jgi:hypothetical protein